MTDEYDEFEPVLNIWQNGTEQEIPRQIDMDSGASRFIISTANVMSVGLNTIMFGQFLINLVAATSMKQLMKVI